MTGVWVAFYYDMSGLVLFDNELTCLRHAVEHNMQAKFVEFGVDVLEAIRVG